MITKTEQTTLYNGGSGMKRRNVIIIGNETGRFSDKLLIILFCLCTFLIALVPALATPLKYVAIPIILLRLLRYESFNYLLFPLSFLDNMIGTYVAGRFTLLWFYIIILSIKLYVMDKRPFLAKDRVVLILGIFIYFMIVSLMTYGMNSIKMVLVVFCCYTLSLRWINKPEKLKEFLFVVIASTMITAVSMMFTLVGTIAKAERATGLGFTDPNYSSMICCFGLSAILNYSNTKNRWVNYVIAGSFIFGIFRSGSRTGLLAVAIILIMEILMTRGLVKKVKIILVFSIVALVFFFTVLPMLSDVVSPLIERLEMTWDMFSEGNYAGATAGRSTISELYLDYYGNQNLFKKLFGGNIIASTQLYSAVGLQKVTHNVYLDYLMAFGAVGGVIMMGSYITRMIHYFIKQRKTDRAEYRAVLLMKLTGLIFGVGLALLQVTTWWIVCLV